MNVIRIKAGESRDYAYAREEKISFWFNAEAELSGEEGATPEAVLLKAQELYQKVIDPALKQQVRDFAARSRSFKLAMEVVKPQIIRKFETMLASRGNEQEPGEQSRP